jgi:FKBP-type peptidyl-prolyl cis-trans isomerase 2
VCGNFKLVKIEKGRRVRIRVHLALVEGDSIEKCVVEYVHGGGTMLPGLETILTGKETGAKLDGVLPAKEAFGNPQMHPTKHMKKAEFPKEVKLATGERFAAKGVNGQDVVLQIEKIEGDSVEVRLVHPLADRDIKYEVEVLSVADPSVRPPPIPAQALKLEEG